MIIFVVLIANLDTIYSVINPSFVSPYPPNKALRENNIVVYRDGSIQNRKRLDEFIKNANTKEKDQVKILTYKNRINIFSKHFITRPSSIQFLKCNKEYIEYKYGVSDVLFTEVYSCINKEKQGNSTVYILSSLMTKENSRKETVLLIDENN